MEVSADEIEDLLYWTLQQSWPVEEHLVNFATRQIGYVNKGGNCGISYPGSPRFPTLQPGQVAVQHWSSGLVLAVSEVAYLKTLQQFLVDRGEGEWLAEMPEPESRRRQSLILELSGMTDAYRLTSYLKQQLGVLTHLQGLSGIKGAMMDDRLSNMPESLVIEGLGFIETFLPYNSVELQEMFADYQRAFPCRQLSLQLESPSGVGQFF
ncbi:hypothetical protein [uncultured Endozoicomonas sp.]|uniref:hypothetical protein n=1 Tax=uncultured Endozoicomonas sp. TaxID=432652 RepID=UPI002609C407|nr:hypothetical protein [uncultured Endozoicomonas sp.]